MENSPAPIPETIDDVTPAWMAAVLGEPITAVRHEQIGEGIGVSSALYRSHLTGSRLGTVITKLPAFSEEAVFTATILRMYIREVRFFELMASDVPVRVPQCFHTAVDEQTSKFVILMEDLSDLRTVDQTEGMDLVDAETAVDALAAWHAKFWGKSLALAESGAAVSLADPIYPAALPGIFLEGFEKSTAELDLGPEILEIAPAWAAIMPSLLQDLCVGPTTACHGDYRGDNLLFGADGAVAVIDFQLIGHGSGAFDLAYFITQSLDVDMAHASERSLFDRWVAALIRNGVAPAETADLWEQYRRAAYFCLTYPMVASRGLDFDDPRQLALLKSMTTRFARAARDLNLAEFSI